MSLCSSSDSEFQDNATSLLYPLPFIVIEILHLPDGDHSEFKVLSQNRRLLAATEALVFREECPDVQVCISASELSGMNCLCSEPIWG